MIRKVGFSLAMVATVAVASACQRDMPLSPSDIEPSFASATGGVETNISAPVNITSFISCANGGAGETVQVSGNMHFLINVRSDNKGGFGYKSHSQPQGLTGIGAITGDKYQGTGVTQYNNNVKAGETTTYVNNFRMIGQGPGNNLLIHQNVHITINANGEVTATHDNLSVECK